MELPSSTIIMMRRRRRLGHRAMPNMRRVIGASDRVPQLRGKVRTFPCPTIVTPAMRPTDRRHHSWSLPMTARRLLSRPGANRTQHRRSPETHEAEHSSSAASSCDAVTSTFLHHASYDREAQLPSAPAGRRIPTVAQEFLKRLCQYGRAKYTGSSTFSSRHPVIAWPRCQS